MKKLKDIVIACCFIVTGILVVNRMEGLQKERRSREIRMMRSYREEVIKREWVDLSSP